MSASSYKIDIGSKFFRNYPPRGYFRTNPLQNPGVFDNTDVLPYERKVRFLSVVSFVYVKPLLIRDYIKNI